MIIVVMYLKCFMDLFYCIQRGIIVSTLDFELDSSNKYIYGQPVIGPNVIIDEPSQQWTMSMIRFLINQLLINH